MMNYVCRHMQLTRDDLVEVIRQKKLTTLEQIQDETNAAVICGSCARSIEEILDEELDLRKTEDPA